jgi:hypothetical protein
MKDEWRYNRCNDKRRLIVVILVDVLASAWW